MTVGVIAARLRIAGCVFAEDEARLMLADDPGSDELESMVARRCAGAPLEHVLGWAQFCGLRIAVHDGVFVPRRRTEFLIRCATELVCGMAHVVAVDLCCGSGALGIALRSGLAQRPGSDDVHVELHAADLDPLAVRCARSNLDENVPVYQGDLFTALPNYLQGRVDIMLANVPYVPTEAIRLLPTEAREYEALVALDGGPDGQHLQRRVIADARLWLAPGGHLFMETSDLQADSVADLAGRAGLSARIERDADLGATLLIAGR